MILTTTHERIKEFNKLYNLEKYRVQTTFKFNNKKYYTGQILINPDQDLI